MSDTSPEAIAVLCERLRRILTHSIRPQAAAMIEALAAERDAALAEGARQERAAIVAYTKRLRHEGAFYRVSIEMDNHAMRIERGDHRKASHD